MPYNVSFISLGCAKNQVNCEQMMATVQHAGHNVSPLARGGGRGRGQHLRLSGLCLRGGHR